MSISHEDMNQSGSINSPGSMNSPVAEMKPERRGPDHRKLTRRPGLANILQDLDIKQIKSLREIWRERYGEELEISLTSGHLLRASSMDRASSNNSPCSLEGFTFSQSDVKGYQDDVISQDSGVVSPTELIISELEDELSELSMGSTSEDAEETAEAAVPSLRRRNAVCYDPQEHSLIFSLLKKLQGFGSDGSPDR